METLGTGRRAGAAALVGHPRLLLRGAGLAGDRARATSRPPGSAPTSSTSIIPTHWPIWPACSGPAHAGRRHPARRLQPVGVPPAHPAGPPAGRGGRGAEPGAPGALDRADRVRGEGRGHSLRHRSDALGEGAATAARARRRAPSSSGGWWPTRASTSCFGRWSGCPTSGSTSSDRVRRGPGSRPWLRRSPITDRVRWYGEYPDDDLPRRMADADFLVLPSVTVEEMFGLVVLEAMAAGRPVITTALPSAVREVNVPGVTGLEVPLRDVSALARALETLSRDPAPPEGDGRGGPETGRGALYPDGHGGAAHRAVRADSGRAEVGGDPVEEAMRNGRQSACARGRVPRTFAARGPLAQVVRAADS